jgi:hypothetical protein
MSERLKWGNHKVMADDMVWDSMAELARYRELQMLQAGGDISALRVKPVYVLAPAVKLDGRRRPPIRYIPDFDYQERGELVVEDVKGATANDPYYRLKRHLMRGVYDIEVREVMAPTHRGRRRR